MNAYVVTYRIQHTGNGSQNVRKAKTVAYNAQDAAFQALIEPRAHASANKPWVHVTLLSTAPYKDGDKFDFDADLDKN